MKKVKNSSAPAGLTLMETVVALFIIAISIPLVFATLQASTSSQRAAEDETRAAWLAKQMSDEVGRAWAGEGVNFSDILPYPDFGEDGNELIFGFDREGNFQRILQTDEWRDGVKEEGVVYVVKAQGVSYAPPHLPNEFLSKVKITVGKPALAPEKSRQVLYYHILKSR